MLKLTPDLKAAGADVWLDQMDISPGQRWDLAIQEALANCSRLIVVLSPSSVASTTVLDEVSYALENHKPVIPVLYRDCKIPFRLGRLQYVDFRGEYARGFEGLLRTMRAPAREPATSLQPDHSSRPHRADASQSGGLDSQHPRATRGSGWMASVFGSPVAKVSAGAGLVLFLASLLWFGNKRACTPLSRTPRCIAVGQRVLSHDRSQ